MISIWEKKSWFSIYPESCSSNLTALNVSTGRNDAGLSERDAVTQVREMAVRLLEDEDVVMLVDICERVREIQPDDLTWLMLFFVQRQNSCCSYSIYQSEGWRRSCIRCWPSWTHQRSFFCSERSGESKPWCINTQKPLSSRMREENWCCVILAFVLQSQHHFQLNMEKSYAFWLFIYTTT